MIRYLLAVSLTVAILGAASPAVDHGATLRSERQVQAAITTLEDAGTSLLETESAAEPNMKGPRRIVEIDVPGDGTFEKQVQTLTFSRVPETNKTRVVYRIAGQSREVTFLDVPLVSASEDPLAFGGRSGPQTLSLSLLSEDGTPVVVVTGT